jgi:E3 ubiquitin-protein ligase makorin
VVLRSRHFSEGEGTCPFGTSCFYRHVYPDGREEAKDPMMLRRYMGAEGEVRIVKEVRLSDFLDTPQGRAALGTGSRGARRPAG